MSNRRTICLAGPAWLASFLPILLASAAMAEVRSGVHTGQEASNSPATSVPFVAGTLYLAGQDPAIGEALGADDVVVHYRGRELRFASEQNARQFEAAPAMYVAKADQWIAEQQRPYYPLKSCVVSGKPLEAMKAPVEVIFQNWLVRLCCQSCRATFEKDPAIYLNRIAEAVVVQQQKDYPLTTCLISGRALGSMGEPVNYVVGNRLVRFCCKSCQQEFGRHPQPVLARLDAARQVQEHNAAAESDR